MNKIAEQLRLAGEYMDTHGKFDGNMYGPDGSVCSIGALASVRELYNLTAEQHQGAVRALREMVHSMQLPNGENPSCIAAWSDSTPQDIVVKTFFLAADKAEFGVDNE